MGTLTYPTKTVSGGGTSSYVEGKTLPAAELQADFDAVATVINGGIDNSNIDASAAIAISKLAQISGSDIDDYSATAAEAVTEVTPGDSATVGSNLATTFDDEVERLRYRINRNKGYGGTVKYATSAGATTLEDVTWVESPIRSGNLLVNSGFEGVLAASGDPPYGWTEVNTLTASSMADAGDESGTHIRHYSFTGNTASGISQTLGGLKPDTKYLFVLTYEVSSGNLAVQTSGGLAASNAYQDPTFSDSSSTAHETIGLVVQSDSSGSDITVEILALATTTALLVKSGFYELGDGAPQDVPTGLMQTATHNTEEVLPATFTATQWNWETVGELTLAQFVPSHGYRLIYEVTLTYCGATAAGASGHEALPTTESQEYGFRVQLDTGGGAATVDGPYVHYGLGNAVNYQQGGIVRLQYVIDNPTPGLTYTLTTDVGAYNNTATNTTTTRMTLNPTANGVQSVSKAWLRLERI